jgi:hypothetical protein
MASKDDRKWKPGQSGNPNGRPRGTGQVSALRKQIEDSVPEIITAMVEKALTGDAGAARLLLERVVPPLKPAEQGQAMDLPDGTLTDQSRAVLALVASGELPVGQGAVLLSALGSVSKVVEVDELAARIAALEEKHAAKA